MDDDYRTDGERIAQAIEFFANQINKPGIPFHTNDGVVVGDPTEAMIFIGTGLHKIGEALGSIAETMQEAVTDGEGDNLLHAVRSISTSISTLCEEEPL